MGKEGRKTSTDIFNLRETERTTDTIDTNRYPKPEEKRDRGSGGGGDVRRRDRSRDRYVTLSTRIFRYTNYV